MIVFQPNCAWKRKCSHLIYYWTMNTHTHIHVHTNTKSSMHARTYIPMTGTLFPSRIADSIHWQRTIFSPYLTFVEFQVWWSGPFSFSLALFLSLVLTLLLSHSLSSLYLSLYSSLYLSLYSSLTLFSLPIHHCSSLTLFSDSLHKPSQ